MTGVSRGRSRIAGIVTYRRLDAPFDAGMPLYGFTPVPLTLAATSRARKLKAALYLTIPQSRVFTLGALYDGRWALVGRTHRYIRCAVEQQSGHQSSPRHRCGHISQIEPLPEARAKELLVQIYRGLSAAQWEQILAK
ncbi:MAG TPA: hypothetical protein VFS41_03770 [Edaphobacter sp.]|nr:hypothetical protein [Edaphobacter sp.]